MATARFEAEKFNGTNDFGLWKIKMKALLVQQGLADALTKTKEDPDKEEDPKVREMQQKAHSAIILSLHDKVLREVSKEKTAAEVWLKLESLYMTKSLANRLFMKQRLYSYKIVEDRGIGEQLDQFNKFVDDLEGIDVSLGDEDKAIILLNALPRTFDQLKDAMLYGRESTITLQEVQSALKTKEMQKGSCSSQDAQGEALNVKKFKAKKGQPKNASKKGQDSKPKDQETKETRTCHYCKKPGHLKRNCFSWKKKQAQEGEAQNAEEVKMDLELPEVLNVTDTSTGDSWILDSGCSFHMTPNREWFEDLEPDQGCVLLGNNQFCKVKGKGNIRLRLEDGSIKIMSDVRYIPDIKRNLISLGLLEQKGCHFTSREGVMTVYKNSLMVMKARRESNLYYLMGETVMGDSNVAEKADL